MIWVFLGGVAVGVFGLFVVLVALAWREEMAMVRLARGEDGDDE